MFVAGDPGEPAGTVANAAPHPEQRGGSALVELRLAALGDGELRLGSADGPPLRRARCPTRWRSTPKPPPERRLRAAPMRELFI